MKRNSIDAVDNSAMDTPRSVAEEVMQRKLADIATLLQSDGRGKSRLYEDILSMVERSLFKIALQRNNHVKGAAAAYLGINRNTFQKKMEKLGLNNSKE
jgi:DNA-binding protein Fis